MTTLTISSKNQVVIPKEVRQRLNLKSGDRLIVQESTDDTVTLKKQPSLYDLMGTLKPGVGDPVERIRAIREPWRENLR